MKGRPGPVCDAVSCLVPGVIFSRVRRTGGWSLVHRVTMRLVAEGPCARGLHLSRQFCQELDIVLLVIKSACSDVYTGGFCAAFSLMEGSC